MKRKEKAAPAPPKHLLCTSTRHRPVRECIVPLLYELGFLPGYHFLALLELALALVQTTLPLR